jgi:DNA-binding NarL/FixJ family response regulator
MKPIHILIADDHAVVLEGLAAMIGRQADMKIVGQASNGNRRLRTGINIIPTSGTGDCRS